MDDFQELQKRMEKFVKERNWTKYHSPKNLAMSIAIESAELMEIFQWMEPDKALEATLEDNETRNQLKDEIADIIIYCLSLANVAQIDLKQSIIAKMERNNFRFPVGNSLD